MPCHRWLLRCHHREGEPPPLRNNVDSGRIVYVQSAEVNQSTATVLLIIFLGLLAVSVTVASILILSGGKFYRRIPEKSRPRRWFVAIFFSYFVVFCVWFPVWFLHPGSMISHVLRILFAAFTGFIAGWYALGRIRYFLLPIMALFERIVCWFTSGAESGKR
jgi:hypothetical protein